MRLPHSVAEDPGLARLWEAANIIMSTWVESRAHFLYLLAKRHFIRGNDIFSLPKEVVSLNRIEKDVHVI